MNEFLQRLKERKLVQWTIAYVAAAFALLQGIDIVAQRFAWPDSIERILIIASCIGFFFVLVLAWYHGERGVQKVSGSELIILALLLVLGGGALWRFGKGAKTPASTRPVTAAAPAQSIAVLPFDNLSANKDNEYFADGIAEELLNELGQLPGLEVAGRTSSFAFKGHDEDLREIARKLGVAYLVEGSVRRSQDRVRITAQLIKAETGFHLWSQTFDRKLTDIFAVQDEISGAITAALKPNLLKKGGAALVTTKVAVSAYDEFLKGQSLLALRGPDNLTAAREHFQAALKIDDKYAPALVSLARTDLLIPTYAYMSGAKVQSLVSEAEQLIQRGLAIDSNNPSAHLVLGSLYSNYQWRWEEAGREFDLAQKLAPGSAEVANFAGDYYGILLDPRTIATEQRAFDLDPLSFNIWDLAWANWSFGHYEKAIEHARAAAAMAPDGFGPYKILVLSYGQLHRFPEMHQAIAEARARTGVAPQHLLLLDVWAAIAEGRREDGLRIQAQLEPYVAAGESSSAFYGYDYLLLGESEKAKRWLQLAYEQRDPQLIFNQPVNLAVIAKDPLARSILDRPGLKELVEIQKRNGQFKLPR